MSCVPALPISPSPTPHVGSLGREESSLRSDTISSVFSRASFQANAVLTFLGWAEVGRDSRNACFLKKKKKQTNLYSLALQLFAWVSRKPVVVTHPSCLPPQPQPSCSGRLGLILLVLKTCKGSNGPFRFRECCPHPGSFEALKLGFLKISFEIVAESCCRLFHSSRTPPLGAAVLS